jgi:hypothetical protein
MALNRNVLFRGAATTSVGTTLYTVPESTITTVLNIVVTNTASSVGTFTIALDSVSIQSTTSIGPNSSIYIECAQIITAGKTITGGASATSINFHISGEENK